MLKSILFFLAFTIFLTVGAALAMSGKGLLVLLIGVVVYLGLFAKYGCLTH